MIFKFIKLFSLMIFIKTLKDIRQLTIIRVAILDSTISIQTHAKSFFKSKNTHTTIHVKSITVTEENTYIQNKKGE